MIGDAGLGIDICGVRFDVKRRGGAGRLRGPDEQRRCSWTHTVEYSNPTVVTNIGRRVRPATACRRSTAWAGRQIAGVPPSGAGSPRSRATAARG